MTGDIVEKDQMVGKQFSDLEMASRVRMLMRDDLNHEFICMAGRDRIMYLSQQVDRLENEVSELSQNVCDSCSPDNYGWVFNRVEGKAACVCMTEAEPFQILLKALERLACLGNGDRFGNSDGNLIAIAALRSVLPLDYSKSL